MLLAGAPVTEEGRRFISEVDLQAGLTQLGFDFLVLGELGRRHFLTLDAGMGFPPLVHPVSYGLRDQTVGFCHLADRTGLLNDLQHDLLFELFAVLGCGHNTDFTSHVRLNLFFVTSHETCSTPMRPVSSQMLTLVVGQPAVAQAAEESEVVLILGTWIVAISQFTQPLGGTAPRTGGWVNG